MNAKNAKVHKSEHWSTETQIIGKALVAIFLYCALTLIFDALSISAETKPPEKTSIFLNTLDTASKRAKREAKMATQ